MPIFIGFESGLELLLSLGLHGERSPYGYNRQEPVVPTRAMPRKRSAPTLGSLRKTGFPMEIAHRNSIDICVADEASRRKFNCAKTIVWEGAEFGSWLRVDDNYCVCSPEACFLQMARTLSLVHLIELGFLLCGSYTPEAVRSFRHSNLKPLTSASKISCYLERCAGQKGVVAARRAIKYVQDGSASVMETKLHMLLCLPGLLGGQAFPKPLLNREIKLPDRLSGRTVTNIRKPDLYWGEKKVAIEYDGKLHLESIDKIIADRRRCNELEAFGIHCLIVHFGDLVDLPAFYRLLEQARCLLDVRDKRAGQGLRLREAELFDQLLGKFQWPLCRLELRKRL